jgi:ABC-type sugar transport system substrate-binding protein
MARSVFVLLIGNKERGAVDDFQLLQEETALSEGTRLGVEVEVVFAPPFDQLAVLKRRLLDAGSRPVDAMLVEPANVAMSEMVMRDTRGKAGLVLLNTWTPAVEEYARAWGSEHPFGTVSSDQREIGAIQGRQIGALLPKGGVVLALLGPQRTGPAVERLQGTTSALRPDVKVYRTEAAQWAEANGGEAFMNWYASFRVSSETVNVVAAQSDELAVGAREAARTVANPAHRTMFGEAKYLGIDGCPRYGRRMVDSGVLTATVVMPSNTDIAIRHLHAFWQTRRPFPLRARADVTPYPPTSV